jgi:hypothetical protein
LRRLEEINREPHEIRENILTRISRIGANSNGGKTLFVTGMFGSTPILNRIAQTIVVEDVYELFIGIYAPSDSGTAVMLDWNGKVLGNNPLDYIGLVAKDGVPVGTIEYSEVEEDRSIWATMEKISMKSIQCCPTGNMLKTIDFIDDLKIYWRFNRHTPSHSIRIRQKALIFNGFHAFPVV